MRRGRMMLPMRIRRRPDDRPPLTDRERFRLATFLLAVMLLVLANLIVATRFFAPAPSTPRAATTSSR